MYLIVWPIVQQIQLGLLERDVFFLTLFEFLEKIDHDIGGAGIVDTPQRSDYTFGSGMDEPVRQTDDAFPLVVIANSRFASAQDDQFSG